MSSTKSMMPSTDTSAAAWAVTATGFGVYGSTHSGSAAAKDLRVTKLFRSWCTIFSMLLKSRTFSAIKIGWLSVNLISAVANLPSVISHPSAAPLPETKVGKCRTLTQRYELTQVAGNIQRVAKLVRARPLSQALHSKTPECFPTNRNLQVKLRFRFGWEQHKLHLCAHITITYLLMEAMPSLCARTPWKSKNRYQSLHSKQAILDGHSVCMRQCLVTHFVGYQHGNKYCTCKSSAGQAGSETFVSVCASFWADHPLHQIVFVGLSRTTEWTLDVFRGHRCKVGRSVAQQLFRRQRPAHDWNNRQR